MATATLPTTAEDLEIESDYGQVIWADVDCLIEFEPGEEATFWEPGCDPRARVLSVAATKCGVDIGGDTIAELKVPELLKAVSDVINGSGWCERQDDWALETYSDDEQGRREAALEDKFQARRDEQ